MRSSSEWKLITARRPPGRSIASAAGRAACECSELVVHRDAKRLEDALGRMALAESRRCRDRRLDRLDELAGALERMLGATAHDGAGDLARVALLAVAAEDVGELALVPGVEDLGGGR